MRLSVIALAALMALLAVAGTASTASAASSYETYAITRDKVLNCVRDRQWNHLSDSARKTCKRLRKRYEIWSPTESGAFYIHCLTSKCMPAPEGDPDPRQAPPAGAQVFKP